MSHPVRTHTRNVNGKTVTVRHHTQSDDPARDQKKRHNFERRALRDRQQSEALYPQPGKRAPGERKPRKKNGWQRAKGHARKAKRLWRRHKVKAAAHGLAALGWAAGHATRRTASKARKTWKNWHKRRQGKS